jgi:hypothetical protein
MIELASRIIISPSLEVSLLHCWSNMTVGHDLTWKKTMLGSFYLNGVYRLVSTPMMHFVDSTTNPSVKLEHNINKYEVVFELVIHYLLSRTRVTQLDTMDGFTARLSDSSLQTC